MPVLPTFTPFKPGFKNCFVGISDVNFNYLECGSLGRPFTEKISKTGPRNVRNVMFVFVTFSVVKILRRGLCLVALAQLYSAHG